jgi:hypothetical protein
MRMKKLLGLAAALLIPATAFGQGAVTGTNIPSRYGPAALIATQTRPTSWGVKNRLNQLFVKVDDADSSYLRIAITGNVSNNGIVILLDTKSGGNNVFSCTAGGASARMTALNGDTLDSGFSPDYAFDSYSNYADNNDNTGDFWVDIYDLQAQTKTYLGDAVNGATTDLKAGATKIGETAYQNVSADSEGVGSIGNSWDCGGSGVDNAANATKGWEIKVSLAQLGITGSLTSAKDIKVMAIINGNNWRSNQLLPGLPDCWGSLDSGNNDYNFNGVPGRQYAIVRLKATSNDLGASTVQWGYTPRYLIPRVSDNYTDAHAPIQSVPTVYGDRAYVVDSKYTATYPNSDLFAVVTNGTSVTSGLDATFGTYGRLQLDDTVAGRPVVRSVTISGTPRTRVYAMTKHGTVYACDTNGANFGGGHAAYSAWGTNGTSTTSVSTPVVVQAGTDAVALVIFKNTTSGSPYLDKWYVAKMKDNGSGPLSLVGTPLELAGATDVLSSPSLIQDGSRLQIATKTASGGKVFTVNSTDMTVLNSFVTDYEVKTPTVLTHDQTKAFIADAPSSGNGSIYCFNASTGNLDAGWGTSGKVTVNGAVEQAPFVDYLVGPNVLYLGTSTGFLYAVSTGTGAAVGSFPVQPFGAIQTTGAPVLLKDPYTATNGKLYVPTADGLYAIRVDDVSKWKRYPVGAPIMSVSASGRSNGSIITGVDTFNGNVYGFIAQDIP